MANEASGPAAGHDPVNHPAHYRVGGFEVIDIIEAFELGFRLANTVKYILRAGRKADALEDLRKARWYLDREIAHRESAPKRHDTVRELTAVTPCAHTFVGTCCLKCGVPAP